MKIILICLILLLTGCFENSGNLKNECVKSDTINNISYTTTYTINFKQDIISDVTVSYKYKGDKSSLNVIKESITSNDTEKNLDKNIIENTDTSYEVLYKINSSTNDIIKNKFGISEKRSTLVSSLKEQGFTCK